MLINKITHGFVIQTFDTDKQQYTHQEFIAGDVDYEVDGVTAGGPISPLGEAMAKFNFGPGAECEPYLPFDMLQPSEMAHFGEKLGDKKS